MNLEELNLASNLLETLPDSIGLLHNLKILDVSGNKLSALPDSISHCRYFGYTLNFCSLLRYRNFLFYVLSDAQVIGGAGCKFQSPSLFAN